MEADAYVLAEIPGFGRIYDCGGCGNLHLSVGPVSVTLTREAYLQLAALMNSSAAQFEVLLEAESRRRREGVQGSMPPGLEGL
ncbi:hypothetical protein [uncultured Paludibaculum sp.]|uniref:hypothetical protein n=1 Tax=uncultured Paludibaculum sp. TaxID=1765020 RepID=UPI002AAB5998|nr:hypothetical protein [uncultured Paludibaculum sp.]